MLRGRLQRLIPCLGLLLAPEPATGAPPDASSSEPHSEPAAVEALCIDSEAFDPEVLAVELRLRLPPELFAEVAPASDCEGVRLEVREPDNEGIPARLLPPGAPSIERRVPGNPEDDASVVAAELSGWLIAVAARGSLTPASERDTTPANEARPRLKDPTASAAVGASEATPDPARGKGRDLQGAPQLPEDDDEASETPTWGLGVELSVLNALTRRGGWVGLGPKLWADIGRPARWFTMIAVGWTARPWAGGSLQAVPVSVSAGYWQRDGAWSLRVGAGLDALPWFVTPTGRILDGAGTSIRPPPLWGQHLLLRVERRVGEAARSGWSLGLSLKASIVYAARAGAHTPRLTFEQGALTLGPLMLESAVFVRWGPPR